MFDNELFGMLNLSHRDTGLDVNVYLSDRLSGPTPTIEFQNNTHTSFDLDSLIPMTIDRTEPEILPSDRLRLLIKDRQLNGVKSWIKTNHTLLMELWNEQITIFDFVWEHQKV